MNKFSLMEAVQNLLESNGGCYRFTIALIDFDSFKEINSRYGHITGDEILKVFADISRRYIRKSDLLGRFGGEEFVFVFNETDERQATQILKRIHEALESYYSEALDMPITFSSGILYVDNVSYALSSCSKLIDDVDRLMYQAKNDGRGRAVSSMGKTLFAKGS
jgi:diguanylate cyclase (GGDEF)-like protein